MKKEIINEIKRIQELIGTKSNIHESIIDDLLSAKFINPAEFNTISKSLRNRAVDLNSFDDVIKVIKRYPQIYDKIFNKIDTKLPISVSEFQNKSFDDLLDLASSKGIDPDLATEWIQRYQTKNNVKFKPDVQTPTPNRKPKNTETPELTSSNLDDFQTDMLRLSNIPSETEIKSIIKKYVPQATESEVARATIRAKKHFARNIDTITQEEIDKIFEEEVRALTPVVAERIRKQATKIGLFTRWQSLPKWIKKAIIIALVLGGGGLGLWGVITNWVLTMAETGIKDVIQTVKNKFGGRQTTNSGETNTGGETNTDRETNTSVGKKPEAVYNPQTGEFEIKQ